MPLPAAVTAVSGFLSSGLGQTILGGIKGLFGGRSKRKAEKAQQESTERMNRENNQVAIYRDQLARKNDLEDRRYKEDGIRGYAGFYKGNRTISAPTMTDPNTVKPVNPYANTTTVRR